MKRLFAAFRLLVIVIALLASASSCQKKSSQGTVVENPSEMNPDLAASDSPKADKDSVESPPPPPPLSSAASTKDILSFMESSGYSDLYASGIFRRMAEEAPEYARSIINSGFEHFIIVDKRIMKLALYDKYGRELLRYGIACSKEFGTKHKKGDNRTPEGLFSAQGVYDSTDWLFTDDDGKTSKKKGQFGPRFIRLSIPGTSQIGIHGTCAPWSIGSRSSHGCIRVTNEQILTLVQYIVPGMPVLVSPGDRDQAVNEKEGTHIVQFSINKPKKKPELTEPEKRDSIEIKNDESIPVQLPDTNTVVVPATPVDTLEPADPSLPIGPLN